MDSNAFNKWKYFMQRGNFEAAWRISDKQLALNNITAMQS